MPDDIQVPDSVNVGSGDGLSAQAGNQPQQQVRLELDDSQAETAYANLCFVSSTAEEVIVDLALNRNPLGSQGGRVRVSQRVILSPYTAKRLANLLTSTVQRHEAMFGAWRRTCGKGSSRRALRMHSRQFRCRLP